MANATPNWDNHAAEFNFDASPFSAQQTFGDIYNGSDFDADIAGITASINAELSTAVRPPSGDSPVRATLENWG